MGEPLKKTGLTLLNGPGNDMVSVTAMATSGVHLVLFTTGRGNPFGGAVPTVKIASNSNLAEKKKSWIDFNAGDVFEVGFDKLADELMQSVCKIASGELCAHERNDYREIAIFKNGVTL